MTDDLAAHRSAWWGPLRQHGHDWKFDVRSHADLVPPSVAQASVPPVVDVRESDRSVDVRLHVLDPGRGAVRVVVSRLADERSSWTTVRARLVSGTRRDGWWLASVPFSRCTSDPGDRDVTAGVTDRVGNVQYVQIGSVEKLVLDHRGPGWRFSGFGYTDGDPQGPLVVSFDEPAFGITTASLVVTVAGEQVPAPWACTDPGGTAVDCAAGPVAKAQLDTGVRPSPSSSVRLLVNPEHVLDLRDASGNPAQPRSEAGWYVSS
jgi:hypothetical protein